jgi:hypothetical protein
MILVSQAADAEQNGNLQNLNDWEIGPSVHRIIGKTATANIRMQSAALQLPTSPKCFLNVDQECF